MIVSLFDFFKPNKIPNKLHFVFGLSEDFGGKPWSLCLYLFIRFIDII